MLARPLFLAALLLVVAFPAPAHADPAPVVAPLESDLGAIQETLRLPRATRMNDADGDKVFDSLEQEFLRSPVLPVIITLRHDASFERARAHLLSLGVIPANEFSALGMFSADLDLARTLRVAGLDMVRQVEWSQPGGPELDTATVNFGARAVQNEIGLDGSLDGDSLRFSSQDIVVAILDSGFDGKHQDLAGKFLVFVDSADGAEKPAYDGGYHGTHVAGIVGGLGRGKADLKGVAPGAAFVGIKIEGPRGSKEGTLFGIDWLLKNHEHYGVRVSTISYGFGMTVDGTDATEIGFDKLFAAGVLPFKSTGNSGPQPGTVTVPGGARGIIAVANMFDPGRTENPSLTSVPVVGSPEYDYGFHLASSSSRGPTRDGRIKPDLAAPGSSINSVANGTGTGYRIASGTSMASPFAAGTAALVFAADPALTPEQVRKILFATAEDWGAKGPDPEYGVGRLDSLRAVQVALSNRLVRERADASAVQRVLEIAGPDIPYHTGGVFNDVASSSSFEVKNAKQPLAVTLIHNGPKAPVSPPPPVTQPPLHGAVLELRGPDGMVVKRSLTPTMRQQVLAFIPTAAGKYVIEAKDLVRGNGLVFDVSAGLPPVEAPPLPELGSELEVGSRGAARAVGAKSAGSTPIPDVAALVALAIAVALVVRKRGTSD